MTPSAYRNMRRTVVTGGAGFIGSHLADALTEMGVAVLVVDNLANGRPENLTQARAVGRCTLVRADITDFDAIRPHFDGVPSEGNPRPYLRANVDGTVSMLCPARYFKGVERRAELSDPATVMHAEAQACRAAGGRLE